MSEVHRVVCVASSSNLNRIASVTAASHSTMAVSGGECQRQTVDWSLSYAKHGVCKDRSVLSVLLGDAVSC